MMIPQKTVQVFQKKILSWYVENKRDLPWRDVPVGTSLHDRAYRILVSEVMLQQTQVARVIPKYEAWLKKFPTVEALAKAKTSEVLRLWSGLGYNRRALNLQKAAQVIVEQCNGIFPQTVEELKRLPGVGEYTARAVMCFAFDQQMAVVDTNVRKVILLEVEKFANRKWKIADGKAKDIQEIADQLLPTGRARDWNQALMDYSAQMLRKERVSLPKQSRFAGSNRYYRGKLLRLLLEKQSIDRREVGVLLKEDFSEKDTSWLEALLAGMVKEKFIILSKNRVALRK